MTLLKQVEPILDEVMERARGITSGRVTSYIPELAHVDPDLFAVSICDLSGSGIHRGDVEHLFTLQSVSKVLSYACALDACDRSQLNERVGVEPTGEDFDSIIKLDRHKRPFNPMVNAGAIAVTDLLMKHYGEDALKETLAFFGRLIGRGDLDIDRSVHESELRTGERNRAIAHLLKNFGLLEHPVEEVLSLYFAHCAVRVTTRDLARLGATLAQRSCPTGVVSHSTLRDVLSVMLTCGMYNYAGQWVFEVGYPAKSGVSGGVMSVVPDQLGIGVFSPRVDDKGSSPRGVMVNKWLSEAANLHLFACPNGPP